MTDRRKWMVALAQKFVGIPYIWGGNNPHIGWDCSGCMVWILQVFGLLGSGDNTAQGLADYFPRRGPGEPLEAGDLVFYGKDSRNVSHVMMYIGDLNGVSMVCGASGGDHTTTSEAEAKKRNAMVKMKPMLYRMDLLFAGNVDGRVA